MNVDRDIRIIMNEMPPTGPGTTDIYGAIVDTAGWEGVIFTIKFGALSANQVTRIKAQQDSNSDGSTMTDLAGSLSVPMGDGDSGKALILEIGRPQKRYVRCVCTRSVANAAIDSGAVILYGPTLKPMTSDASIVAQKSLVSPSEGIA